jgi:hypothetical protein
MEYTFTVTENEANIILAALGELPAKNTIDTILKIKNQVVEQMQANPKEIFEESVDES